MDHGLLLNFFFFFQAFIAVDFDSELVADLHHELNGDNPKRGTANNFKIEKIITADMKSKKKKKNYVGTLIRRKIIF